MCRVGSSDTTGGSLTARSRGPSRTVGGSHLTPEVRLTVVPARRCDAFEGAVRCVVLPAINKAMAVFIDLDAEESFAIHVTPRFESAIAISVIDQEAQPPCCGIDNPNHAWVVTIELPVRPADPVGRDTGRNRRDNTTDKDRDLESRRRRGRLMYRRTGWIEHSFALSVTFWPLCGGVEATSEGGLSPQKTARRINARYVSLYRRGIGHEPRSTPSPQWHERVTLNRSSHQRTGTVQRGSVSPDSSCGASHVSHVDRCGRIPGESENQLHFGANGDERIQLTLKQHTRGAGVQAHAFGPVARAALTPQYSRLNRESRRP
jgi:hypothetical protein